jgi:aldehyde oxidoreductase
VVKISLTVNGVKRSVDASADMVLLDLLREQLGLTGAKQSCDRKGQCGACTVVVDGKAVRSCLKKVADMNGADVITVEGLGTPDNPHLIQEAFVLAGAIQCGFCTPGMIMSTKALLDVNPNPDTAAIKKALARNLCRCTGYVKIIDAVKLAGKFLRGETTPAKIKATINKKKMIGESHPRPSSYIKACGVAKFGGDIKMPNMLEIAAVHSTEFHAIIKSIDSSSAKKMPGVAGILTAQDIKGTNRLRVMAPDQLILAEDKVRTLGDPIAIVAAETREQARAAAAAVKVTYEKLPVMLTPEEAMAPGAVQIHPHSPNLCWQQPMIKGDVEKAYKKAACVVEGNFSTQMNHQAPLEPETCVSYLDGEELVVIGRSIMIHAHAGILQEAVGAKKVRYQEPFSGGQFGIKAHITSEGIAAAAAMHFKRPVRYVPSLAESMNITTKRHPFDMKAKLAFDAQGKIIAHSNEFVVNKGAYFMLGPVMPTRALLMLSSSYNIPNIYAFTKLVYTNNCSGGAARGAGPPQVAFPLESLMDMAAEKLGIDPLEIRKRNSLKMGESLCTGAVPDDGWPFPELCDAFKPKYEKAKKEAAEFNKKGGKIKRGVGIAVHSFGVGEPDDVAANAVEINPDDSVTIYAAVADPGEGDDSMLTQLAAQVLGMPLEKMHLYTRDTQKTVASGPSAGSRQTYMNGGAMLDAIQKMLKAMQEAGSRTYAGLKKAGKPFRYDGAKAVVGQPQLDPKTGQGGNFDSHVHNIQMAEIEVDTETGEVKVLKMTSGIDAGTIIHPKNFEGQNEGGMDQGVGYALREEFVLGKTKDWVTFKFPTIDKAFEVEYVIRETPRKRGPLGATGIGELTMTSTAPSITNAIHDACGARIYHLPATPEKIKAALKK